MSITANGSKTRQGPRSSSHGRYDARGCCSKVTAFRAKCGPTRLACSHRCSGRARRSPSRPPSPFAAGDRAGHFSRPKDEADRAFLRASPSCRSRRRSATWRGRTGREPFRLEERTRRIASSPNAQRPQAPGLTSSERRTRTNNGRAAFEFATKDASIHASPCFAIGEKRRTMVAAQAFRESKGDRDLAREQEGGRTKIEFIGSNCRRRAACHERRMRQRACAR